MSADKRSPLERLQRQKIRLQVKSDALYDSMEENFNYLKDNAGSLVGEAAADAVLAKMPPFVQQLFPRAREKDAHSSGIASTLMAGIADKAADIVPFFVKGKKAFFLTLLLKQLTRFLPK